MKVSGRDRDVGQPPAAPGWGPGQSLIAQPRFARPMSRVTALSGIAMISFSAIFVRAADVSPGTAAFFRAAYAVPALMLAAWLLRGRGTRPWMPRVMAFAAGLFLAVDLNFWHRSIALVGAGLATVLANLQVLFVAGLAWAIHGERPTRTAFLAIPVAFVGVLLTAGVMGGAAYGASPTLGAVFGVLAAVAYTGFLLLFRMGSRSDGTGVRVLLDATAGTAVGALAIGALTDPGFTLAPSWPAHGWLAALALLAHAGGWVLIARALPRLPALETSVLLLMQPALTVLWGVSFFDEAPSPGQWIGVTLILAGIAAASLGGAAHAAKE